MSTRHKLSGFTLALAAVALGASASVTAQSDAEGDTTISPPEAFTALLACGQDVGYNEPSVTLSPEDAEGTTVFEFPRTVWYFRTREVSDPRMDGRTYGYLAGTEWSNPSRDEEISVFSALWHVVNEGGEWIGPYSTLRSPEIGYATNSIRLEGHGGYDGLYAIIEADFRDDCGWDVSGFILERDVPPFPEPIEGLGG